jgi:hypothetical protein
MESASVVSTNMSDGQLLICHIPDPTTKFIFFSIMFSSKRPAPLHQPIDLMPNNVSVVFVVS